MNIFLYTDFGSHDLYVGQIKAAILGYTSDANVVDLLHDVSPYNIRAGAHLLAALATRLPVESTVVAVVDPGVGGPRRPIALRAGRRWYVGPDNGLLSVVAVRAAEAQVFPITWRPTALSNSFHGRDLFAPAAILLAAQSEAVIGSEDSLDVQFDANDLCEIIYIDHYGNAMTGLRCMELADRSRLIINGRNLVYARVFSEAPRGSPFWYKNSLDLIEIAVNYGSAADELGLQIGDSITIEPAFPAAER